MSSGISNLLPHQALSSMFGFLLMALRALEVGGSGVKPFFPAVVSNGIIVELVDVARFAE